jgi:hypothetical protein
MDSPAVSSRSDHDIFLCHVTAVQRRVITHTETGTFDQLQ